MILISLTDYLPIIKKTSVVSIHKKHGKRPYYDIYAGRKVNGTEFTEDSIWCKRRGESLPEYEIRIRKTMIKKLPELIGKKIACWCITTDKIYPIVCHVQILMKLINEFYN